MTGPASWRERLKEHPGAAMFPLLAETAPDELRELGDDIKKNGIQQPIVLWSPTRFPGRDLKEKFPTRRTARGCNSAGRSTAAPLYSSPKQSSTIVLSLSDRAAHPLASVRPPPPPRTQRPPLPIPPPTGTGEISSHW